MPSLRLHIVYMNKPISCCFSKKHLDFSVFLHQNTKTSPVILHNFDACSRVVQEISPKMQFFLRFVCKYFCIACAAFAVRSFCSAYFASRSPLFQPRKSSLSTFSQKKILHNRNNSLVNARFYLMCNFFCIRFPL